MKADLGFRYALRRVIPLIIEEQDFLKDFFGLEDKAGVAGGMMDAVFQGIEPSFVILVEQAYRRSHMFMLSILAGTDLYMVEFGDLTTGMRCPYLADLITGLQKAMRERFVHFIDKQIEQIHASKVDKKRPGVLWAVDKFAAFYDRVQDSITLEGSQDDEAAMIPDIENQLLKVLKEIMQWIEVQALRDSKYTALIKMEAQLMQNMHRIMRSLSIRTISKDMGEIAARAEVIYNESKAI